MIKLHEKSSELLSEV